MTRQVPCFFVQNNWVERLTIPVAQFAHRNGIALEDRSSSQDFDPEHCGIQWDNYNQVLPYGSVQFIRRLKRSARLAPHVLHDDVAFAATTWQTHLDDKLLNCGGFILAAREVPALLKNASFHLRPNAEDKAFNARVFDAASWRAVAEERKLSPDLPCWASPVKAILAEWRCWIVDGRLVEVSQYRRSGRMALERGAPADVAAFAATVAKDWLPAPCVVLDVAQTTDGLHILEFNPIHCAGWYAADVDIVLQAWLAWSMSQA